MSEPPEPSRTAFIDLHAHTTASDGSLSPAELVAGAQRARLAALAITDHDTFDGYEEAVPLAQAAGLDLVRGIELNSRLALEHDNRITYVHLLGYWPSHLPSGEFSAWLEREREDRRDRNSRLAGALAQRGLEITLAEVEARGRSLTGRTHFASVLVDKGYAADREDAFRRFLGETAPSYVERQSERAEQVIGRIRSSGGIPVLAHPVRLALPFDSQRKVLERLKHAGLLGLEIYHSEHSPELQARYRQLAQDLDLLPTGGSDFHGTPKPDTELGSGVRSNLRVPREFLDRMRAFSHSQLNESAENGVRNPH